MLPKHAVFLYLIVNNERCLPINRGLPFRMIFRRQKPFLRRSPGGNTLWILLVLLTLQLPQVVQARDRTASEWLRIVAESGWEDLGQVTDSLVATITSTEELERIELAFSESRSRVRSPWDEIRWHRRLGMASSRINEALAGRRVAGSLIEADEFASRAVDDYPFPSAIKLYGEILIKEERFSEAVGLLLSGFLMTDNHDLEMTAKSSFELWGSSKERWEDFKEAYSTNWINMIARKAIADASMKGSDGSDLCDFEGDRNEEYPFAVLVLWDEYPSETGASILREMNIFLRSSQISHQFCFAGMERKSADGTASRLGIPWDRKSGRISVTDLRSSGIGALPAFAVLDSKSNIVAFAAGENRRLTDVLRRVLEDLQAMNSDELETGELR